jgi:hypothetical protein
MHALRAALDLPCEALPAPAEAEPPRRSLAADARLFATTFVAGFLFVSILIA